MNTIAAQSSHSTLLTGVLKRGRASRTFTIMPGELFAIGWGFGLSASGGGGSLVDGINLAQAMFDGGFAGLDALSTSLAPDDVPGGGVAGC